MEYLAETDLTFHQIARTVGVKYHYVAGVNAGRMKWTEILGFTGPVRETAEMRNRRLAEDLRAGMSNEDLAVKYGLTLEYIHRQRLILNSKNKI